MTKSSSGQSGASFLAIAAIFLVAQTLKFMFWAPMPALGGDAAQKWLLAKDLASGSLDVFRSVDYVNHHYLRWGSWIFPVVLVSVFGDSVAVYFASTALPATIAALLFLALFHRHFGFIVAALIAAVWIVDPELNRAFFQLLPTGAGLLPLALICWCLQLFLDGRLSGSALVACLVGFIFWLYGAKETNVFFAPGLFFAVWLLAGRRYALGLLAGFVLLYVLEGLLLGLLQGHAMPGGRLLALLSDDAKHLHKMFSAPRLVKEQEDLWDAGILSRWYSVHRFHVPVFIPSVVAFATVVLIHVRRPRMDRMGGMALGLSLTALSFVVLTSFFFVSLDPVRLGQPMRSRYIAILLPLSFFILVYASREIARGRVCGMMGRLGLAGALSVALAYFGYHREAAGRFLSAGYAELYFNAVPRKSLAEWAVHFQSVGQDTNSTACALSMPEFRDLYFAAMYVRKKDDGSARLAHLQQCPQTRRLK